MHPLWVSDNVSEIPCDDCGGEAHEFYIPNDIWNRVIRKDGHEQDKEYLCVDCFLNELRRELGL